MTLSAANGPATAVTPAAFVAAVICAADATEVSTVKARSAPCCAANAWSNGLCASASMPSASVEAAVETSTTRPMMIAWSLRPPRPPRAAWKTALMTGPL